MLKKKYENTAYPSVSLYLMNDPYSVSAITNSFEVIWSHNRFVECAHTLIMFTSLSFIRSASEQTGLHFIMLIFFFYFFFFYQDNNQRDALKGTPTICIGLKLNVKNN